MRLHAIGECKLPERLTINAPGRVRQQLGKAGINLRFITVRYVNDDFGYQTNLLDERLIKHIVSLLITYRYVTAQ